MQTGPTSALARAAQPGRPSQLAGTGFRGRFVDRDFARRQSWGKFADRDRDFARRRFHGGFVGWFGPVFWPYADDDIVDYALWPYDYGPRFYAYGYGDIYDSIFWPYTSEDVAAYAAVGAPSRVARTRRSKTARHDMARQDMAQREVATARFAQTCGGEPAQGIADWPIQQIEQTVEPTQEQRPLIEELAAASAKAAATIKAACPRQMPVTPTGRLAVMESRLTAMREAVDIVRPALVKFYDSLTDEQKARFNAMGAPAGGEQADALARACAEQAAGMPQWPTEQIERAVRLNEAQRAKLADVQAAAARSADALKASCPTEAPATPPGRLDAAAQRLDALLDAVKTVRERLEVFYGSLTDEQKARFNAMGAQASRQQS